MLLKIFLISFFVSLWWAEGSRAEQMPLDQLSSVLSEGKKLVDLYCHAELDDPDLEEYTRCTQGIQLLEQILQDDPHNTQALALLMEGYRNRSREKGIEIARQLLALDPNNGDAYFYIADLTESPQEKALYLRKAVQLIPQNRWVHGELAWALLYYNEGSIEEVITEVKQQIVVNPDDRSMILNIADELFDRGFKAEAREVYIAYLHSAQRERRACGAFAEAVSQEEMEQLGILSVFLDQCGGHGYYKLALKEGDLEKKIALLKKALELSPDHKEAQKELEKALGTPQ